jgi:hypothetical protein
VGQPWAKSRSNRTSARDLSDAADVAGSDDTGRGLHHIRDLAVAQPQGVAEPSDAFPLLEGSFEDIQYYFHIPVAMRAETVARNDPILIVDPHASETCLRRIPIVREGKSAI